MGLPLLLDGTEGQAALAARRLGEALRALTGVVVGYVDERLTTRQAERELLAMGHGRRRRRLLGDQVAAALILQQRLASEHRR